MRKRLLRSLYVQVLVAVLLGAVLGHLYPEQAVKLEPLGQGFIKLIKMLIAPIVFATVVTGIARMGDMKKVGRVGGKALLYFEAVTTLALIIGLMVGHLVAPGRGINADPATLDAAAVKGFAASAEHHGFADFVLGVIPDTVFAAFARGDILQVLLVSVLFGVALSGLKERARAMVDLIDDIGHTFFGIVAIIMRLAPLGALGAMAFTVGKYGLGTLAGLGKLMLTFYLTSVLFVAIVLGAIAWRTGFSLWKFLRYIREEIFIVLGTSSSESALPRLMTKLEALGCGRSVVGLVVPMGYSFNLDGTSIYLTLATMFIAQALNIDLPLGQELTLLAVLLLTSKGAAAVTGGGFVTLAATLASTGHIPVAGLALILGIDRFMSEARAIVNLIGNGVAAIVIAKWEKDVDMSRVNRVLALNPNTQTQSGG